VSTSPAGTTPDAPASEALAARLGEVQAGIADAVDVAGRNPAEITTIVVTKFHPASLVRELYGLGVRDFGENRHQDAAPKAEALADLDPVWHFVGQLQSKKAKAVLHYAHTIHSVDRESLLSALVPAAAGTTDIFIQLNLTDDPARGGVAPGGFEPLAERVLGVPGLRLRGLMAVAPLGADPRPAFATVAAASVRLQRLAPAATALSMGMSADYREAILEGATHLRIGSAITGIRPGAG
jgi:pyridoxal phosphate enzyme (YggS family)